MKSVKKKVGKSKNSENIEIYRDKIKEYIPINIRNLKEDLYKHPQFKSFFSDRWATASRILSSKKANRDKVYAQRDLYYRKKFEKEGTKTTEAVIKSTVIVDELYQKALLEYFKWIEIEALLRTAREDMSERITALNKLYDKDSKK